MDRKSPMKIFEKEVGYTLTENARKMLREAAEKEDWRVKTMYKSPIEIIYQRMQTQVDGDIIRAIQSYNIKVDRDELIKALNYDRDQYRKGFEDGKKAGPDWIPVSERLPEDYTKVLITNEYGIVTCITWNTWYQNEYENAKKEYKAIAWKPLPKPYESEAESLDYQRAVEDTEYCERHEATYNPDDGSM